MFTSEAGVTKVQKNKETKIAFQNILEKNLVRMFLMNGYVRYLTPNKSEVEISL